jgi:steroid delta-isomerase-like uncharacterized protein
MSAQDNMDLARTVYRLFNEGDLEAAADYADPQLEIQLLAMGQTFSGRDGFMDFMSSFRTAFPDITIEVTRQVSDGDHVVSESTWNATHNGPLMSPDGEIPATGKSVTGARICEVWTIRDGKVSRLVNYQDPAFWLRQLGLVP